MSFHEWCVNVILILTCFTGLPLAFGNYFFYNRSRCFYHMYNQPFNVYFTFQIYYSTHQRTNRNNYLKKKNLDLLTTPDSIDNVSRLYKLIFYDGIQFLIFFFCIFLIDKLAFLHQNFSNFWSTNSNTQI